ncbi:MAG: hypothetical protein M1819_006721 [Sarea resinae]|nr:MAG: hypothetical protein M1819_006721 [Sarea resinae]
MTVTGLYFIPEATQTATLQTLIDRITIRYEPEPRGRWGLDHRLMRETATLMPGNDDKAAASRALQFLSLWHRPGRTIVGVTAPKGQDGAVSNRVPTVIATPQGEDLMQLMISKLGPLWSLRQTLHVTNGTAYAFGDFSIRLGEVKTGPGGQKRGIIAEIEWSAGDDQDGENTIEDWDTGEIVIRDLWEQLEAPSAREYIKVPGVGKGTDFDLERQYFELLRLRG